MNRTRSIWFWPLLFGMCFAGYIQKPANNVKIHIEKLTIAETGGQNGTITKDFVFLSVDEIPGFSPTSISGLQSSDLKNWDSFSSSNITVADGRYFAGLGEAESRMFYKNVTVEQKDP